MKSSCLEKKSEQLDHRIRQLVDGGHLASFRMKEKKKVKGDSMYFILDYKMKLKVLLIDKHIK